MEAHGMGRTMNTRLSQQVRGRIVERMRHVAAETGIAVVTVPARDTSKQCPQCLRPLRHCKAPDRPTTPGWKWAICQNPDCGWQGDRDQGAWQRIAARGLAHQPKTVTDRTTGALAIRAVVDTLEAGAVITPTVLPRRAFGPGRPASGGTRSHGPETAAPRSPPAPGRDDDQHTHHQPIPATRSGAGRGIPPPRPRHPSTVGKHPGIRRHV
ncbi:zinc ribbon domain-containing protein [Streptomyces sp. G1]|uniref:zinc ribbon domain-containing protein n=1 Tax=Streptomyces sp. G1 TaxID=361572 RepID=UPI0027E3E75F|nr:zinc ribbon domain-containing protein [Streptomyces sp. G1]